LLFQTTGGIVGDGICMYSILRTAPIVFHLYNVGSVAVVLLGANLSAPYLDLPLLGQHRNDLPRIILRRFPSS
jgi:hypothetical protein